jgi:hypothetical protein
MAGEVVELLLAGDWEQLGERCTPRMRQVLGGRQKASRVWSNAIGGKGAYAGIESQLYTPEDAEQFQADLTLGFERGSVRVRVAVDQDGLTNGLVLRPDDWSEAGSARARNPSGSQMTDARARVVHELAGSAGLRLRWAWYRAARRIGFPRSAAMGAARTGVVDHDGPGAPTRGRAVRMYWLQREGFPDHALLVVLRSGGQPEHGREL